MDSNEIVVILKSIIHECLKGRVATDNISETTEIIAELKVDSIEALEILLNVEEKFGITIDDEDLNKELFRTLGKLVDYIQRRLK